MYCSSNEIYLSSINGDFIACCKLELKITSICFLDTDETLLGTYIVVGSSTGTFQIFELVYKDNWDFKLINTQEHALKSEITALAATSYHNLQFLNIKEYYNRRDISRNCPCIHVTPLKNSWLLDFQMVVILKCITKYPTVVNSALFAFQ